MLRHELSMGSSRQYHNAVMTAHEKGYEK